MSATTAALPAVGSGRGLRIALWTVQLLLAALFAFAGFGKTFTPMSEIAVAMPPLADAPVALVRFIGISELLGALGLVLPAATRILPRLTVLAAAGLVVVMVLAAAFHLSRGESPWVAVAVGALAAFVAWGRATRAPIAPR